MPARASVLVRKKTTVSSFALRNWHPKRPSLDPISFNVKATGQVLPIDRIRDGLLTRIPAEFRDYIRALAAACDLEHRGRLNALVDQMPEDPDAVWSMFDHAGYELSRTVVALAA